MTARPFVVYEDDNLKVLRRKSNGSKSPAGVKIYFKELECYTRARFNERTLEITIDELFDLTDVLDDLCDHIEDEATRNSKKTP